MGNKCMVLTYINVRLTLDKGEAKIRSAIFFKIEKMKSTSMKKGVKM